MSENVIALVAGGAIAILSFGLAVAWDIIKSHREEGQRSEAVLSALKQELLANAEILQVNRSILEQEIAIVDQKKEVVEPLSLLQNSSWDVVKIQIPKILANNMDNLINIRKTSQLIDRVNETIRSRENYRINNGAMSNFNSHLKLYDQRLLQDGEQLQKTLQELMAQL